MDARFDLDQSQVDALLDDPEVDQLLQEIVDDIADVARGNAPADSGEGAASIHGEVHRGHDSAAHASTYTPETDAPIGYVSWDQDHFYLLFAEIGTEDQPATPFLRPALDQARI
jgi:HK97 gp10 family phage protein